MTISSLTLRGFRNYSTADLSFEPGVTILTGDNGSGKTNLLEAIHLLADGRSFRTARDERLVKNGEPGYYVKGVFISDNGDERRVEVSSFDKVKRVAVDGKEVRTRREIIGRFLAVVFLPADVSLIDGEPSRRRDFFNMLISNVDAAYLAALVEYYGVLKHRNAALKVQSPDYTVFDDRLAELGYFIIERANAYAEIIARSMNDSFTALFGTAGGYAIRYENGAGDITSADSFAARLKAQAGRDVKMRTTSIGPQRGDFRLFAHDTEIRHFSSQGEKRLAAVIMNIARQSVIARERNERPILLIDDALLELDAPRRARVLDYMKDRGQMFITVTDVSRAGGVSGTVIDVPVITGLLPRII
ncbi:MAG: DNA replication/repair protein RecF [Spirochaetes bacterium]|nr:DNA replication/repair protein RecF [Spirochaetota bacterium]